MLFPWGSSSGVAGCALTWAVGRCGEALGAQPGEALGAPGYEQGALDVTCATARRGCARGDAHRVPWEHVAALGTACKPCTRCAVPAWLVGDTREPQPQLIQRSGQFWEHSTCPILMAPWGLSPAQGWDMASGPFTPPRCAMAW